MFKTKFSGHNKIWGKLTPSVPIATGLAIAVPAFPGDCGCWHWNR